MELTEKAEDLVNKYSTVTLFGSSNRAIKIALTKITTKQCALIAVENEYNSLREQLFNLRACGVIENEKTYLERMQPLLEEENKVKQEIEKL